MKQTIRRNARALLFCSALLLCSAPPAARAADDDASASALLGRARAQFFGGRFDRARALLSRVLVNPTLSSSQRAQAHMTLGLIEEAGGRRTRALAHFRRALALDATLTLDAKRFKPGVVALFEKAKGSTVSPSESTPPTPPRARHRSPSRAATAKTARTSSPTAPAAPPRRDGDEGAGFRYTWTVIGAGASLAALAVAIGLGASAQSKRDDGCALLREVGEPSCEPATPPTLDATRYQRYRDLQKSVDRQRVVSNVFYGAAAVGAALTTLALVLELRAARRERTRAVGAPALSLSLGRHSAAVTLRLALP